MYIREKTLLEICNNKICAQWTHIPCFQQPCGPMCPPGQYSLLARMRVSLVIKSGTPMLVVGPGDPNCPLNVGLVMLFHHAGDTRQMVDTHRYSNVMSEAGKRLTRCAAVVPSKSVMLSCYPVVNRCMEPSTAQQQCNLQGHDQRTPA